MSILIKGMEMPVNCFVCPCYHHKVDDGYYDYEICRASGTVFNDGYASVTGHKNHIDPFKARLDNCPLVPVPPHGRLGDLEKLEQMFIDIDNAPYSGFDGSEPFYSAEDAAQIIRLSPTIIPAEEGEFGE